MHDFGLSWDYVPSFFSFFLLLFTLSITLSRLKYSIKNGHIPVIMNFWLERTPNSVSPQMGFTCHISSILVFLKDEEVLHTYRKFLSSSEVSLLFTVTTGYLSYQRLV